MNNTNEFQRTVQILLNKIAPQKFDVLSNQITLLEVGNQDKIECLANMIFEKAVREPLYYNIYANLCRVISDKLNGSFKSLLFKHCDEEFGRKHESFEDITYDTNNLVLKEKIRYECLLSQLRKFGNISFIGELYKCNVLSEELLLNYLMTLLTSDTTLQLKCFCQLVSIVGVVLDQNEETQIELNRYFDIVIERQKNLQMSAQVKFALLDILELRDNQWEPRFVKPIPKTLDQIRSEALENPSIVFSKHEKDKMRKKEISKKRKEEKKKNKESKKIASS